MKFKFNKKNNPRERKALSGKKLLLSLSERLETTEKVLLDFYQKIMEPQSILFYNKGKANNPIKATNGSSGYDLSVDIDRTITELNKNETPHHLLVVKHSNKTDEPYIELHPGGRVKLSTGIFMKLPIGYEAQITPRSGYAIKNGLSIVNTPGKIDSDYIGEIAIILINLGGTPFDIYHNMKLAQLTVYRPIDITFIDVHEGLGLPKTERGEKGFGSSGE